MFVHNSAMSSDDAPVYCSAKRMVTVASFFVPALSLIHSEPDDI